MKDAIVQAMERLDAEVADLRVRLLDMKQKHAPCEDVIASLRKQNAALHLTRKHAEVCRSLLSSIYTESCRSDMGTEQEGSTKDTDKPYASYRA